MFRPIILSFFFSLSASSIANATSVLGSASLTVQNSFSVEQTQSINFGNVLISNTYLASTYDSSVILSPQGELTTTGKILTSNDKHSQNTLGSPAVFSISNSVPFIDLTLDVSHHTELVHIAAKANNGRLHLSRFIASSTHNTIQQYISGDTISTDETGKIELAFGASVTFDDDTEYDEGLYKGTYSIQLHY
jgi:hypothetical protein